MPPDARARPRGALEREILTCLAAAGRPLTPAAVRAELSDQLAYTTVMTTLARLYAKGAVFRQPVGRAYAYALRGDPAQAEAAMTAHRMLRLLETGQDRAGVLSQFVADLSQDDERLLSDLLAHPAAHSETHAAGQTARPGSAAP